MTDFKIRRGLSTDLFINGNINSGVVDGVVLETGCWYLCTDTAELFLCISLYDGSLTLKRINDHATHTPSIGPGSPDSGVELINGIIGLTINADGKLVILYADGTEETLDTAIVGKDGAPGKDGLTTAIKIGNNTYVHAEGVINLTDIVVTKDTYNADINSKDFICYGDFEFIDEE
jgi:hypothetical protein